MSRWDIHSNVARRSLGDTSSIIAAAPPARTVHDVVPKLRSRCYMLRDLAGARLRDSAGARWRCADVSRCIFFGLVVLERVRRVELVEDIYEELLDGRGQVGIMEVRPRSDDGEHHVAVQHVLQPTAVLGVPGHRDAAGGGVQARARELATTGAQVDDALHMEVAQGGLPKPR